MKLVLLRHGESLWNKENLYTGWTDVNLSAKGILESETAAKRLKEADIDFDYAFTSYLKRAIHTLNHVLDKMDRDFLPVTKAWELNERHYGALQGLNKQDTVEQYGADQVLIWRRSYDVLPPLLEENDDRSAKNLRMYQDVNPNYLPMGESLETCSERVIPYFETNIKPLMLDNKRVLIVAHGNSLRALLMEIEHLSPEEILKVNIPTGTPLLIEFDEDFNVIKKEYLVEEMSDSEEVKEEQEKQPNEQKETETEKQ